MASNDSKTADSPAKDGYDPILDSIADGVFSVDKNWRITSFNRAAEKITGIPREEAIGQLCWEVFKANICENNCALKRTMKTNQPIIDQHIYIITVEGEKKPVSISTAILRDAGGNIIGGVETFRDLTQMETLRKELSGKYVFSDIISRNEKMQELFHILPNIAQNDAPVLIAGESGTGKELFARAIHNIGPRKDEPFVAVNCGALPDTLLESELFGYKKGAFTGAVADKPGRFKLAGHGTIFLDEIGEMSPNLQVKLLRVLENNTFEPLGGVREETTHARVITATNRDLEQRIREGLFRQDLYYRINVITLNIPPLRERMEDVPLLVEHFIRKYNALQNKHIQGLSRDALEALMNYSFPGNVRELQNFIQRAFILAEGDIIHRNHLPPMFQLEGRAAGENPERRRLKDQEQRLILDVLRECGGNREQAARILGIHRATLYRKLKAMKAEGLL